MRLSLSKNCGDWTMPIDGASKYGSSSKRNSGRGTKSASKIAMKSPSPEGGPHRSRHREQGEGEGRNEEAENEMRRCEQRHAHADQRVGDDRDREQPPVLPPQVPVLLGVRRR